MKLIISVIIIIIHNKNKNKIIIISNVKITIQFTILFFWHDLSLSEYVFPTTFLTVLLMNSYEQPRKFNSFSHTL